MTSHDRADADIEGMTDYISKPINQAEMAKVMYKNYVDVWLAPQVVHRPRPRPLRGEVEPQPAIEDRQLAAVRFRPEAVRSVAGEIRDGHQAAGEEGDGSRQQSDRDEDAAEELDRAGDVRDVRGHARRHRAEESEQLL